MTQSQAHNDPSGPSSCGQSRVSIAGKLNFSFLALNVGMIREFWEQAPPRKAWEGGDEFSEHAGFFLPWRVDAVSWPLSSMLHEGPTLPPAMLPLPPAPQGAVGKLWDLEDSSPNSGTTTRCLTPGKGLHLCISAPSSREGG